MTTRVRTLAVGGTLLAFLAGGLLVGFLALGKDGQTSGATETSPPVSPSETRTDVRAQVEQAYLDHWEVYADALLTLDGSRLSDVLAGAALREVEKQVEDLTEANQPARVRMSGSPAPVRMISASGKCSADPATNGTEPPTPISTGSRPQASETALRMAGYATPSAGSLYGELNGPATTHGLPPPKEHSMQGASSKPLLHRWDPAPAEFACLPSHSRRGRVDWMP